MSKLSRETKSVKIEFIAKALGFSSPRHTKHFLVAIALAGFAKWPAPNKHNFSAVFNRFFENPFPINGNIIPGQSKIRTTAGERLLGRDFVITKEWIERHKTMRGGWTRAQLESIGVSWPPSKGWKDQVVGRRISDERRVKFERFYSGPLSSESPVMDLTGMVVCATCGAVHGNHCRVLQPLNDGAFFTACPECLGKTFSQIQQLTNGANH